MYQDCFSFFLMGTLKLTAETSVYHEAFQPALETRNLPALKCAPKHIKITRFFNAWYFLSWILGYFYSFYFWHTEKKNNIEKPLFFGCCVTTCEFNIFPQDISNGNEKKWKENALDLSSNFQSFGGPHWITERHRTRLPDTKGPVWAQIKRVLSNHL